MAIAGAPEDVLLGGTYTSGPADGDYHVIVTDAQLAEAKTGRKQLVFELTVKDDPNHTAKEGKKLTKMYQSLPMASDDTDKQGTMKGMVKRMCFDGFGVAWPTQEKKLDARVFVGKQAYVRLAHKANEERNSIVAIATELDKLPALKGTNTVKAPASGNRARR